MAFLNPFESEIQDLDGGYAIGNKNTILSFPDFEDGIKIGRLCMVDTDTNLIFNYPTPVVANTAIVGVVLSSPSNVVGSDGYYENSESGKVSQVDVLVKGLATVNVLTADPIVPYAQVYFHFASPTLFGLAQGLPGLPAAIPAPFRFIKEVKTNVWLIQSYDYDNV